MQLKRIYQQPSKDDGVRILVDRVWPRGVSKEKAHLDEWLKEIGPSPALRKWFDHDPKKFIAFKEKYIEELENDTEKVKALHTLKDYMKENNGEITLVYAAKDEVHNHAVILKELIT
ncbi:DUF488 domain-containing protein [Gracilibacillus alcaliphilus]|uniref:DUF488 domain-containing protein n=1 Tax=Gracilibacillus alcaliphilus TaxID=1401441 RepID=UPI00195B2222|nr:DUF488 family protein [Gracilibacillus alcaliphilus]MBM7678223.1 uncharacterized protein YeaO (DUF488 family) [Gracilibacillus alcaliphilus]